MKEEEAPLTLVPPLEPPLEPVPEMDESEFVQHPAPAPEQSPVIEPVSDSNPPKVTEQLTTTPLSLPNNFKTISPEQIELQKRLVWHPSIKTQKNIIRFYQTKKTWNIASPIILTLIFYIQN